ncbi:MAG: hypothetical protein ACJA0U_001805 [Salibacteraceae bacterium]|jgi:hypothetical protein
MKRKTFVWIAILTTSSIQAQEVISTQGDSYSNSSGSIDFTIGEVVINTVSDGSYDMTQGFHQTNWNFVGLEDHAPNYEALVFPNPTTEVLNIKTSLFENVSYTLFDAQGRVVIQSKLTGSLTSLQVSQLAPGNYTLLLTDAFDKSLKTFKLIKQL